MLDANTAQYSCALAPSTLDWLEKQLISAQSQGMRVIMACHQNLLQHSMFYYGYVITQTDALQQLLQEYGVSLFLSGHLHMQHVMEANGVTEIATSALCSFPCQYGILEYADGQYHYETRSTDVSSWAQRQGRTEENLLQFMDFASAYFDMRTLSQTAPLLAENDLSPAEQVAMNLYACEVNRAYFSGHMERYEALDPDGSLRNLWANTGSLYGYYLNSLRDDTGKNYNEWVIG